MTGLMVVAVAGLGVGFVLGQRGIPQTLDEVDELREAIEEREVVRSMLACPPDAESAT